MKTGYVYKLSFDNNPICYIGQTVNLKARLNHHLNTLRRNKHNNKAMQKAFNDGNCSNPKMDVLFIIEDGNYTEHEKVFIKKYREECYNKIGLGYTTYQIILPATLENKIREEYSKGVERGALSQAVREMYEQLQIQKQKLTKLNK